jgi:hypothetical protein
LEPSFGQTKLPGNRQRVNSSGGLQPDRLNNAKTSRDFVSVHNMNEFVDLSYNIKNRYIYGEDATSQESDAGVALR